jgi:uncharacterized protein YceH (UPF0502 family)
VQAVTETEVDREYRREALAEECERRDAEAAKMRRLEDRVAQLERKVRELYEEKMDRLHRGW